MAKRVLVQVFSQGKEFVGWIDAENMDPIEALGTVPFIILKDACSLGRFPIGQGRIQTMAKSLYHDNDYKGGYIFISTAGAIVVELNENGDTAQLCNKARSGLHLPDTQIKKVANAINN